MYKKYSTIIVAAIMLCTLGKTAYGRDQIRVVGSSTVYPFITVVAEEFGRATEFNTPIIESTGTGGGFKLFCSGIGEDTPDFAGASRAIKESEHNKCKQNGVEDVTAIKMGYDGIVLVSSIESKPYALTTSQIFHALARQVPVDGKLVDNPNQKWSDIDPELIDHAIEVYGPPPTSGTRDAFVELVMEKACIDLPEFVAAYPDKDERKKQCHLIREDGVFIETGENDNLIVQKLKSNDIAMGVMGYSFLDQNRQLIKGASVNGYEPSFDNIASGAYIISRQLYLYMKDAHLDVISGMEEFVNEMVSENAIGQEGYLTFKGLIPLNEDEYENVYDNVTDKL